MVNKQKTTYKKPEELLKTNHQVSKSVVSQYAELRKQLEKLGVDTKSHYTLSSPWKVILNLKRNIHS